MAAVQAVIPPRFAPGSSRVIVLSSLDTVNTLPESTIEAFEDHGRIARTIDEGVDEARAVMAALAAVGIDMGDVGRVLEDEGVASFAKSYDELIETLRQKADRLAGTT